MTITTLDHPINETASAPSRVTRWLSRAARVRWVRRAVFYVLLLVLWAEISRKGPWPSYLFPGPVEVGTALYWGLQDGIYLQALATSLTRLLVGFGIALVGGVVLGALIALHDVVQDTVGSLVIGLQALPSVCWLPLAILWFGLNDRAVIFVVVMGSLFSILLGVESGIRNTSPLYLKAARNLGAGGLRLCWQVVLPSALPTVLAGLKQGWAFAWRSLMAAELLFYTLSLGNLLQTGRDLNDAAAVMSVMALIILVGVAFNQWLFAPLERRVAERWGFRASRA